MIEIGAIGQGTKRWILALGATALLSLQPVRPLVFLGPSMEPTYPDRTIVFTVPSDGHFEEGDVVVLRIGGQRIVKRVSKVPGDRVTQFFLRGEWVDAPSMHVPNDAAPRSERLKMRHRLVPEGMIYVLGDNAQGSVDSRHFGWVNTDLVVREVVNPLPKKFDDTVLLDRNLRPIVAYAQTRSEK